MRFVKSIVTGAGAVVLAGLVLALLVPRAAHAVAATAVQVMNTSAAPAITADTARQASQIVNLQCLDPNPAEVFIIYSCYGVPAGQNFVVTSMTVTPFSGSGAQIALFPNAAASKIQILTPGSITTQYAWAQGLVFTSGQSIDIEIGGAANIYLTGYLTAN